MAKRRISAAYEVMFVKKSLTLIKVILYALVLLLSGDHIWTIITKKMKESDMPSIVPPILQIIIDIVDLLVDQDDAEQEAIKKAKKAKRKAKKAIVKVKKLKMKAKKAKKADKKRRR